MALNKITALAFSKLKPTDKDQNISDGGGLFIRIRSEKNGGTKTFRLAYQFEGKQKWISLCIFWLHLNTHSD